MTIRSRTKSTGVRRTTERTGASGKENFSRTFAPEYLEIPKIRVNTHILTAGNPRVNILIFSQSTKGCNSLLRTDCLLCLPENGRQQRQPVPSGLICY